MINLPLKSCIFGHIYHSNCYQALKKIMTIKYKLLKKTLLEKFLEIQFFCKRKIQYIEFKKYISSSELSYINDLVKNRLKKKLCF